MLLPVRWAAVMERLFEMGVDEIFEAGEDGTLTRMLRDFKRRDVRGVSAKEALS
jgi:malonyl CoA-acyl carrier protein transacylase